MPKKIKSILSLFFIVSLIAITANFLIDKSNEMAPLFTVLIAKSEINIGDVITESSIEPVIYTASAVKNQALHWSLADVKNDEMLEVNKAQMKKVIGKTAQKKFNMGDQITVTGLK